jgi:hypothetical protein
MVARIMSGERWHYVITEGYPREFRFADRDHKIVTVLTIAVVDGKFVIHRDGKPLDVSSAPP